jgi:hypothetical protein
MKKTIYFTAVIVCCLSCKESNRLERAAPKQLYEWSLAPVPNSLDQVGSIFCVDKKNNRKYITQVALDTMGGVAAIPQRELERTTSISGLANFLNSANASDTLANAGIDDSVHVRTSFQIKSGRMIRPKGNIVPAFEKSKDDIVSQINFYKQQKSKVFLITQVINSPEVVIGIDRNALTNPHIKGVIAKVLQLNGNVLIRNNDSTHLNYRLDQPLSILYILQQIDLDVIKTRGPVPVDSVTNISLGATVKGN